MIKSITLDIDGKDVVIPIDKAKELYRDLEGFFGKDPRITYPINPVNPFDTGKYVNPITYGDPVTSSN